MTTQLSAMSGAWFLPLAPSLHLHFQPKPTGDPVMATSQVTVDSRVPAAQAPGISRWWRVVGGLSMNLALGHALRLERLRRPARKTIRLEARRHLHGLHHRGGGVRAHLRGGRTHPGQDRPVLLFAGRRRPGQPGILPVLLHHQPDLPVHLLRCDRRPGQRLRLRHADSR